MPDHESKSTDESVYIDPTKPESLSDEQKELLYQLFLAEEKKDKTRIEGVVQLGQSKTKVWKPNRPYLVKFTNARDEKVETEVYLTTQINRSKKVYRRIVILAPGEEIPPPAREGVLYIKKRENGGVTIQSDEKEEPRALTQEQWERALAKKFNHLEKRKTVLLGKTTRAIKDKFFLSRQDDKITKKIDAETKKINERTKKEKEKLASLMHPNKHREILDNDKNHTLFSAIQAIYGNKYIYENFNVDSQELGAGGTKVTKPSEVRFTLTESKEADHTGSISFDEQSQRVAFRMAPNKKKSGDELKEMAKGEIDVLLEHPSLAKRFNPTKRTIERNEKGEIIAVYFTENQAEGEELDKIIDSLTPDQCKQIIEMLILAVYTDQKNGISHKDLKGGNVLVKTNPESKQVESLTIIDYAFASKKMKNDFCGTIGYTSPEMYTQRGRVDKRTDNYSLGITLRRLCKDRVEDKRRAMLRAVSEQDESNILKAEYALRLSPPEPQLPEQISSQLNPEYAKNLRKVMSGLTAPHPDDRMWCHDALKILGIPEPPLAAEEKAPVEAKHKAPVIVDHNQLEIMARESLYSITSNAALLFLLQEALEKLENYADSLDLSSDKTFLEDCYTAISDSSKKLPRTTIINVIFFINDTILAERKYLESMDPNIQPPFDHAKKLKELKGTLYNFAYYRHQISRFIIKPAWEGTFLAGISPNEKRHVGFGYFFGWPGTLKDFLKWRVGAKEKVDITILGFILTPIKNIFKLFTEFPLKIIAETVNYLRRNVKRAQPSNWAEKGVRLLALGILYPLTIATTGAWLLMRTITSPKTSMKEAIKASHSGPAAYKLLPWISGLCTVAGIAALTILAAPVIAALATYTGISLSGGAITTMGSWLGVSQAVSLIATPVTWLAGQLGITASAALLTEASVLSLVTVYGLLLRAGGLWVVRHIGTPTRMIAPATPPAVLPPDAIKQKMTTAGLYQKNETTTKSLLERKDMSPGIKRDASVSSEKKSSAPTTMTPAAKEPEPAPEPRLTSPTPSLTRKD